MILEDLRGFATLLCMIAFAAVVYWAYAPSRRKYFDEAADIPFAEEKDDARPSAPGMNVAGNRAADSSASDSNAADSSAPDSGVAGNRAADSGASDSNASDNTEQRP